MIFTRFNCYRCRNSSKWFVNLLNKFVCRRVVWKMNRLLVLFHVTGVVKRYENHVMSMRTIQIRHILHWYQCVIIAPPFLSTTNVKESAPNGAIRVKVPQEKKIPTVSITWQVLIDKSHERFTSSGASFEYYSSVIGDRLVYVRFFSLNNNNDTIYCNIKNLVHFIFYNKFWLFFSSILSNVKLQFIHYSYNGFRLFPLLLLFFYSIRKHISITNSIYYTKVMEKRKKLRFDLHHSFILFIHLLLSLSYILFDDCSKRWQVNLSRLKVEKW